MLRALGLDGKTAAVYQALLAGTPAPPSSLARATGLTAEHVSGALESLAAAGLARHHHACPGWWEATSPGTGLAPTLRRQEEALARLQQQIIDAKAAAAYASMCHTAIRAQRLEDPESVLAHARQLARGTTQLLQVTVPPHPPAASPPASACPGSATLATWTPPAGIKILALFHNSDREVPAALAHATQLAGAGAEARTTTQPPSCLMISDAQAALITTDATQSGNGAIYVEEPAIAAALACLFSTAWDAATPLETTAPPPAGTQVITAEEKALLTLLAAGATDETAARQLRLSIRTTRRQVAALMDKLQATSRFQAGHQAAQRGWI